MNIKDKLTESTMLALQGKLTENKDVESTRCCDALNALKDKFSPYNPIDSMDIKRDVMQILENAPDGVAMYRVRIDSSSGWTSHGSYTHERFVEDEYKKENGIWVMHGIRKDDISDAAIAILYNSGELMTKEKADKVLAEKSKDNTTYRRDIVNTGKDGQGDTVGTSL